MSIQGRSNLKSKTGLRSIQSAVGGRPMSGLLDETVAQVLEDTEQITALQAQLASLQAQLAAAQGALAQAQAQIVADAVTIASLQAQVASLQAQVVALQNQINNLGLDKIAQFKIIGSYSELGGSIYVPPSYENLIVNYTPIFKWQVKTLSLYTTIGGAFP